jgi:hypothetical protein
MRSLLFTLTAASFALSAGASTLASFDFSGGPDTFRGFDSTVQIWLGYGYTSNVFSPYSFTPDDRGKTFSATEASDPGFRAMVDHLTSGTDDYLWLYSSTPSGGGSGFGRPESEFFALRLGDGPDLAGFCIENFEMRLDDLQISYADGWTTYTYAGKISVMGQPVPEPSLGTLCLTAALIALAARRRSLFPWRS